MAKTNVHAAHIVAAATVIHASVAVVHVAVIHGVMHVAAVIHEEVVVELAGSKETGASGFVSRSSAWPSGRSKSRFRMMGI